MQRNSLALRRAKRIFWLMGCCLTRRSLPATVNRRTQKGCQQRLPGQRQENLHPQRSIDSERRSTVLVTQSRPVAVARSLPIASWRQKPRPANRDNGNSWTQTSCQPWVSVFRTLRLAETQSAEVFIFTPSAESGVDIPIVNHFEHFFCLFFGAVSDQCSTANDWQNSM